MRKLIAGLALLVAGLACIAAPARADSDPYMVTASTVQAGAAVTISTINASQHPMKHFALQVKGVDAAASAWDVRLEGSLDGTNFWPIVWNGTPDGDGTVKGSTWTWTPPIPYLRTRIVAVTLGSATGLTVKMLATDR